MSDTGAAAQSERVTGETGNLLALMNERDRRYSDRFIAEREFTIKMIEALADEFHALANAQKEAIVKAEAATNIRLEGMNEFRDQLRVQAATFVTKSETDVRFTALAERMEQTQKVASDKIETGLSSLGKQITDLSNRLNVTKGKAQGLDAAWGYLVGIIGLAAAVIAIIVNVTR